MKRALIIAATLAAASCGKSCQADWRAGRCRQIDAELVGCIASVPPGAVEQCGECIAKAVEEARDAGLDPTDCGPDGFEHERSCY